MGQIIDTKTMPDQSVVCSLLLDSEEVVNLKGHLKNIHLFCSEMCDTFASINTRGNQGVTKYFKIPLCIRSRKKNSGVLRYQKLNTPSKVYYVYCLNTNLSDEPEESLIVPDEEEKEEEDEEEDIHIETEIANSLAKEKLAQSGEEQSSPTK